MAQAKKSHDIHLARPAPNSGWDIWSVTPDAAPTHVADVPDLAPSYEKTLRYVALPLSLIAGFSRWLQTPDETLVAEMVQIQLDRLGLAPKVLEGKSVSFSVVAREETRTLVFIQILAASVPESYCLERVTHYESSASISSLPADSLVLWKEEGRISGAFTRGPRPVHFLSFAGPILDSEIGRDLFCTWLELENEDVLPMLAGVELRGDFSEEERTLVAGLLNVPAQVVDLPEPVVPGEPAGTFLPPLVSSIRQKAARRQRGERILAGVAALYAILLVAFILNVAWLTFKNQALRKKNAADQPTVEAVRSTSQRWRSLESAVNPDLYPLEVLFQSAQLLPADGVRFTLFEQRDNRVTIRGEATSAAAAFKLVEDIKAKTELQFFSWEMPRPNILPNDKAEFQIQGTPPDAQTN